MGVAGGDGLAQPLGAIEDVAGGEGSDFSVLAGELAQAVQLEVDVPFGEDEVGVDAEKGAEQGLCGGLFGMTPKVCQGLAVQDFDTAAEGVGRVVGQCFSFTSGGPVPGLQRARAGPSGVVAEGDADPA